MSVISEDVFIIKTFTINDADRVVVFLTREGKKKSGVSQNAMQLKSSFSGKLEPYNIVNLDYFQKNTESSGLCRINHAQLIKSYSSKISGDINRFTGFALCCELLDVLVYENEGCARLFRLTEHVFDYLIMKNAVLTTGVMYYIYWVLKLSGLFPAVENCCKCGRELKHEDTVFFTSAECFCEGCKNSGAFLSGELLQLLSKLASLPVSQIEVGDRLVREMIEFSYGVFRSFSEKELKSYTLFKTLILKEIP